MNSNKLGIWSVSMMLLLSIGLANHVFVLPALLKAAGRDAWLCVFPAVLVVLPWVAFIIHGIMIRTGQAQLREWLKHKLPPAAVWVLLLPVILLLYVHGFQTYMDTIAWTSKTYLPRTPIFVLALLLMLLVIFAVWSGFRTVVLMSCLLLPPVVLLGDFVMSANMPDKNYALLLPLVENGYNSLFSGSLYAAGGLIELSFIVFIQHYFAVKITKWQLMLLIVLLAMLTLGPTVGAITEFGPLEAAKLNYPAFAQWRLVTIGRYIEHVDFFAIFQWISGAFVRISLSLIIVQELLPARKSSKKLIILLLISVSYIAGTILLSNHMLEYQRLSHYIFFASIIIAVTVMLAIWLLSFKRNSDGGGAGNEREQVPGHT